MKNQYIFDGVAKEDLPQAIGRYMENVLHEHRIKNMIQGREIAFNEILDLIVEHGKSIDEIKAYLEKCLTPQGKEAFEKIVKR